MNYTGSIAMSHWFFSTAMGVKGNCRHLAHITVGNRRQPLLSRLLFPPRNNALSTPQKFFPLQITAERWKIFSGVEKPFPLLDAYNDRISRRKTFHYQVS
jgi:hypothetical protein